jgi:hypothetical protein
MTCEKVEPELVAYHFGLVSDDVRALVEGHLLSCGECLRAFVDIKRSIETGEEGPVPGEAARARLRRAVADELRIAGAPMGRARPRRWESPVAFAIAASVVLLAGMTTRAITAGPGSPPYAISEGRGPR